MHAVQGFAEARSGCRSSSSSEGGVTVAEAAMPSLVLRELPQGRDWAALGRMSLRTIRLDNAR